MAEPKLTKQILEDVLSRAMVKEIWSVNYPDAFPFTLQDFSVGALLPSMMYMFRRGYRRGIGSFHTAFAPEHGEVTRRKRQATKKPEPSVTSVARVLASDSDSFVGFDTESGRQILADLLLCHCLENQQHEPGRHLQLIRAFPTHYLSAWIDLPRSVGHLRMVPEALVALLTDQKDEPVIDAKLTRESWFQVGSDFQHNLILKVLGRGMQSSEWATDLHDGFDDSGPIGIDQLLTVRIAQKCGAAPKKLSESTIHSKGSSILNRHSISKQASRSLNEDFRVLLQSYGEIVPRQCLLPMLDSCIGLGLTNLLLSTARALFDWESTGRVPHIQPPWPLFVDVSSGTDRELRRVAEESMEDCERRLRRLPVILMALRIVEYRARIRFGKSLSSSLPDSTERINQLGDVIGGRHPQSQQIFDFLTEACNAIVGQLQESGIAADVLAGLESETTTPNPAWRLAEGVTLMMGDKQQSGQLVSCLRSSMMTNEGNGLAIERRVQFSTIRNGRKSGTVRSVVLTNTMLDFLVHRHLRKSRKKGSTQPRSLSFSEFLRTLREQYGLFVDQAPPGQAVSMELLLRNRRIIEGRLRDLGLLVGVNDAESMKRLRPRFPARELEVQHGDGK